MYLLGIQVPFARRFPWHLRMYFLCSCCLCRLLGFSEEMSWHRGLQRATQKTRRVDDGESEVSWEVEVLSSELSVGIQSCSQMMIMVSNHPLSIVFRFHYHSQQVIGSLGFRITPSTLMSNPRLMTLNLSGIQP